MLFRSLDLFIFSILLTVISTVKSGEIKAKSLIICAFLIAIASFLKFYPLFAFIPLLYLSFFSVKKLGIIQFMVSFLIGFISTLMLMPDMKVLPKFAVTDLSGSVGLRNLYALTFGLKNTYDISKLELAIFSFLVIGIFSKRIWKLSFFYQQENPGQRLKMLITSTFASIPWFLATNYYYRLILLWPLMFLLTRPFLNCQPEDKIALIRYIFIPTLLAFICVYRSFALFQNLLLIPVYSLVVCFAIHEIRKLVVLKL